MRNNQAANRLTASAIILLALVSLIRPASYTRPTDATATTATTQA